MGDEGTLASDDKAIGMAYGIIFQCHVMACVKHAVCFCSYFFYPV